MFLSVDLKIKIANQIKNNDILIADAYQYHIKLLNRNYFYNKFVTEKYLLKLLLHISSKTLIAYFYDNFIVKNVLMEVLLSLNILSFVIFINFSHLKTIIISIFSY